MDRKSRVQLERYPFDPDDCLRCTHASEDEFYVCTFHQGFVEGFDIGFKLGLEVGEATPPAKPGVSTTVIFTPGIPQDNQPKEAT
jgi:hypothetical protein